MSALTFVELTFCWENLPVLIFVLYMIYSPWLHLGMDPYWFSAVRYWWVYTLFPPQLNSLKIRTYNYKEWGGGLWPFFLLFEDESFCLAVWPWTCYITSNGLPFLIHCFYSPNIKITDMQLSLLQSHFLCCFSFLPFLWRLQIITRSIVVYMRFTGEKNSRASAFPLPRTEDWI